MPQCFDHNLQLLGAESLLDRYNKMREYRQDLIFAWGDKGSESLISKKLIRVGCLSEAMEEYRQIVMIVQQVYFYFPSDLILVNTLNSYLSRGP